MSEELNARSGGSGEPSTEGGKPSARSAEYSNGNSTTQGAEHHGEIGVPQNAEHSNESAPPKNAERSNESSTLQNAEPSGGNAVPQSTAAGRKDSPFSAYAVASQVGFLVIIPLLVFIWGGSWLVERFSLPGWLMIVFVFLGIFVMIGSVTSYLYRMIRMYGGDKKPEKNSKLKHDVRDHDYYND